MKKLWIPMIAFAGIVAFMVVYQKYDAAQQALKLDAERAAQLKKLEAAEPFTWQIPEENTTSPQWKERFVALEALQAGQTWWIHKHWKALAYEHTTKPQTQLATRVDSAGNLTLLSFFEGSYPLEHTHVRVKIGSQVYDSTFVPAHAEMPLGRYDKKTTFREERSFSSPSDITILKAIAQNASASVSVQLVGSRSVATFTLSDTDKAAIRESVWLAEQLKG